MLVPKLAYSSQTRRVCETSGWHIPLVSSLSACPEHTDQISNSQRVGPRNTVLQSDQRKEITAKQAATPRCPPPARPTHAAPSTSPLPASCIFYSSLIIAIAPRAGWSPSFVLQDPVRSPSPPRKPTSVRGVVCASLCVPIARRRESPLLHTVDADYAGA